MYRLPVLWCLPATAAPSVSQAFYPFTGFAADGAHSLEFRTRSLGNSTLDETLTMAFATGSALHELP